MFWRRFHPNPAAMAFDDGLADREPDAGAWRLIDPRDPLEHLKHDCLIFGRDSKSVVFNDNNSFFTILTSSDRYDWDCIWTSVLDGIMDDVLKNQLKLFPIANDIRH